MEGAPSGLSTMSREIAALTNYYDWILEVFGADVGRSVLEVGPGYGNFAGLMAGRGKAYLGVDTDGGVIDRLKQAFQGRPGAEFERADVTDEGWIRRAEARGFDTVVLMNVLEHLDDPVRLLKALLRAAPGAKLIILVPAFQALYGKMDEQAGHFKRYIRPMLRSELEAAGASVERMTYFNAVGGVGWWVSGRLLGRGLGEAGGSILFYDRWVVPAARLVDPLFRRFFGQSLIAVARPGAGNKLESRA